MPCRVATSTAQAATVTMACKIQMLLFDDLGPLWARLRPRPRPPWTRLRPESRPALAATTATTSTRLGRELIHALDRHGCRLALDRRGRHLSHTLTAVDATSSAPSVAVDVTSSTPSAAVDGTSAIRGTRAGTRQCRHARVCARPQFRTLFSDDAALCFYPVSPTLPRRRRPPGCRPPWPRRLRPRGAFCRRRE